MNQLPTAWADSVASGHGQKSSAADGANSSTAPTTNSPTARTAIRIAISCGIGAARTGPRDVRSCFAMRIGVTTGRVAYTTSHATPYAVPMWNFGRWINVTTSSSGVTAMMPTTIGWAEDQRPVRTDSRAISDAD